MVEREGEIAVAIFCSFNSCNDIVYVFFFIYEIISVSISIMFFVKMVIFSGDDNNNFVILVFF